MKIIKWSLFLVLFLLASIFPPWDHPMVAGIKFSAFYKPPEFTGTPRKWSVNDIIYTKTPVYEGRIARKLLCFEYFVIVVSCTALGVIFGRKKYIEGLERL